MIKELENVLKLAKESEEYQKKVLLLEEKVNRLEKDLKEKNFFMRSQALEIHILKQICPPINICHECNGEGGFDDGCGGICCSSCGGCGYIMEVK